MLNAVVSETLILKRMYNMIKKNSLTKGYYIEVL